LDQHHDPGLSGGLHRLCTTEYRRIRTWPTQAGQSRGTVLFFSLLLLILLFIFTTFLARAYRTKEASLAIRWSTRGDANLKAGMLDSALEDYRSALLYDPDNFEDQLHLAQALAGENHNEEATGYLLNLLAKTPNNGEVNLELARLAAKDNRTSDATGYYHAAIYGVWTNDTLQAHIQARIELVDYLLALEEKPQALAEIIELTTQVSAEDTPQLISAGNLLLRGGSPERAVHEFQLALRNKPKDSQALLGAGRSEYEIGNYPEAVTYLFRAKAADPNNTEIQNLLEDARAIVEVDPFLNGLTETEKVDRVAQNFEIALDNLRDCAQEQGVDVAEGNANSPLASAYSAADKNRAPWSAAKLRQDPDQIETVMQSVFNLENLAQKTCGDPQMGPNLGLLLIEKQLQGAS
jgi:tetratricopeptide (TPR) repeat protein